MDNQRMIVQSGIPACEMFLGTWAIGMSNVDVDHVREYLKYGPVDVVQEKFSMLDRQSGDQMVYDVQSGDEHPLWREKTGAD